MLATVVALFAVASLALRRHDGCASFMMSDMEVNIPGKYKFENYSITRLAPHRSQKANVRLQEHNPFGVDPDTGQVFLNSAVNRGWDSDVIYGQLYLQDGLGYVSSSLKVFLTSADPCSQLEDVCFWKRVTYKVDEGATGVLGWVTPEYYTQLCSTYKINYTIDDKSDIFTIVPSDETATTSWALENTKPVFISEMGDNVSIKLNCIVTTTNQSLYKLQRFINIEILDAEMPVVNRQKKSDNTDTISYTHEIIKVSRTAAPYARIAEPNYKGNLFNFSINQGNEIFNITKDGIIYVDHILKLRQSHEHIIQIIVHWKEKEHLKYDNISVRILDNIKDKCVFNNWTFCAEISNKKDCIKPETCALATTGYSNESQYTEKSPRCHWTNGNPEAPYSTCTPDVNTCPDGKCDSLEELNPKICPQDCTKSVVFPNTVNSKTGRGIGGKGVVCSCDVISCNCNPQQGKYQKDRKGNAQQKKKQKVAKANSTNEIQEGTERAEQQKGSKSLSHTMCGVPCILGIVSGIIFLAGMITVIGICWVTKKLRPNTTDKNENNRELILPLTDYLSRNFPVEPIIINFSSIVPGSNVTSVMRKYSLPDPKWEFPRQQLTIEQTLGEGEFGRVLKAKAFNIGEKPGYTVVAVKTLKEEARKNDLNDLLSEYQLLKGVSHPNVVQLLGVCTSPGGPIYLIIDFAEHGSLRNYLRKLRPVFSTNGEGRYENPEDNIVPIKDIFSFAWQICNGMAYLSDIKLVHRDLAARNVLLDAKMICKISDFGLTRDVYEDNAYLKKSRSKVPIKWMAPESLSSHIYTSKSDVWSFGILIWELVTLGGTPYPGIAVQNLYPLLNEGYRMDRPPNCPVALYKLMIKCWQKNPADRPTFHDLLQSWEKLLETKNEYLDLKSNAILNRIYFASNIGNGEDNTESNENSKENENETTISGYETPNPHQRKVVLSANYENQQDYTDMRCATALDVTQT